MCPGMENKTVENLCESGEKGVVVWMLATQPSLVHNSEEVAEGPNLFRRPAVGVQNCPDEVHVQMKDTWCRLEYQTSLVIVDVVLSKVLGAPNSGEGELVDVDRDSKVAEGLSG